MAALLAAPMMIAVAGAMAGSARAGPAPATDTYHGVTVTDPWRWLEDGQDRAVKAWVAAQNAKSRAYLDALPDRKAIAADLLWLDSARPTIDTALDQAGGTLFALTYEPGAQQPKLTTLALSGDPATRRTVIDAAKLGGAGGLAIDWYRPSPDGRLVAVSLSAGGSEDGTLHVYDVATGKEVEAPVAHVQYPTAGGSLAWAADSAAYWYTRFPGEDAPEAERHFNQTVWFHKLGSDHDADREVLTAKDGVPRTGEIFLSNHHDAATALASVQLGDGGEWQHFVLTPDSARLAISYAAKVKAATEAQDGTIYGLTVKDSPNGSLVRFAPGATAPQTLVPAGPTALMAGDPDGSVTLAGDRLFVLAIDGGPTRLLGYGLNGGPARAIPTPPVSAASVPVALPGGDLLFRVRTYTRPSVVMRWDHASGAVTETPIRAMSPVDISDYAVTRLFATSKDGTQVPVTVIGPKTMKRDGSTPLLLYGYGGYGINLSPAFLPEDAIVLLKAGGAYAIANVRGGGEYGERWHKQGMLTAKQNVFDDFAAAAGMLKAKRYTSTAHLALNGGSNGGLLMGAVLTQHPGIAKAVISDVGIYDMLRVELDPNGSFNVSEFGSVKDPAQFRALYAYSPLHHVRTGVQYPAIYLDTGDNDGRVNPLHSRKFAAALQASGSKAPVYLRTSAKSGHGHGTSLDEAIQLQADSIAFLLDQLGLRFVPLH
jgi:prolyl oligopeptidase